MCIQRKISGWLPVLFLTVVAGTAPGPAQGQIIDTVSTDTPNSGPGKTARAPDGSIWFVEQTGNRIGAINPVRTDMDEFSLVIPNSQPSAITVDRSGKVWFTEAGTNRIGVYIPASNYLIEYYWGGANLGLAGIAVDYRGRCFFTENRTNRIGMIDTTRLTLQYFSWTTQDIGLLDVACDSFGEVWFTENRANRIGVLYPDFNYVYDYFYTGGVSAPYGIVVDADNDIWFTEKAAGAISLLDSQTGMIYQFDAIGGSGAQPGYIDTWQNTQDQTVVAWSETAPGSGRIGLLNADTGATSQVQASSPFAAPTGVSFAPDNSLWWTEYNASQISGMYYNNSIVWNKPAARAPLFAALDFSSGAADPLRPVLASLSTKADYQIVLVKKQNKGKSKGRQKQSQKQKSSAQTEQVSNITVEQHQPQKKNHKIKKGH